MLEKIDKLTKGKIIAIVALALVMLAFLTNYYGSTDLGDYSDTARYFAGNYAADIRSSHSYLYGFIHSPLMGFSNYFAFKITSLIFLFAIVYSVYIISNRDRRALVLMLVSPVVWYMAPWINPIQLASLCLLWAYYFMERYDKTNYLPNAVYAGIFIGLGLAFWDTILFFGSFLVLAYVFNKKLSHLMLIIAAIFVGLLPRLLLDYASFGFPFFSLIKSFFGTLTNAFFMGRGTAYTPSYLKNSIFFLLVILSIPYYFWSRCVKRYFLKQHTKAMVFLILSFLLILINPQIRYTLALLPIAVLLILPELSQQQWRTQIIVSSCITLIFIIPYIIQVPYSINESEYYDITEVLINLPSLTITSYSESQLIASDLAQIERDYPSETFLVLGHPDYYQKLAHLYWGKSINELVSIQDYNLWKKNETVIFEKRLQFNPQINDRRSIWIGGGIMKNPNDDTNYENIRYAIALNLSSNHPGFSPLKRYTRLQVLKKEPWGMLK